MVSCNLAQVYLRGHSICWEVIHDCWILCLEKEGHDNGCTQGRGQTLTCMTAVEVDLIMAAAFVKTKLSLTAAHQFSKEEEVTDFPPEISWWGHHTCAIFSKTKMQTFTRYFMWLAPFNPIKKAISKLTMHLETPWSAHSYREIKASKV